MRKKDREALQRAIRGVRGRDREEARRPVHDPQPDAGGETPPAGRLVSRQFGSGPWLSSRAIIKEEAPLWGPPPVNRPVYCRLAG
jgi:hypothetical protein